MIFSRLKTYFLATCAVIVSFLWALLKYKSYKLDKVEEQQKENNRRAAEAQKTVLEDAEKAARDAGVTYQEKTDNAIKKADTGDFSGLND